MSNVNRNRAGAAVFWSWLFFIIVCFGALFVSGCAQMRPSQNRISGNKDGWAVTAKFRPDGQPAYVLLRAPKGARIEGEWKLYQGPSEISGQDSIRMVRVGT